MLQLLAVAARGGGGNAGAASAAAAATGLGAAGAAGGGARRLTAASSYGSRAGFLCRYAAASSRRSSSSAFALLGSRRRPAAFLSRQIPGVVSLHPRYRGGDARRPEGVARPTRGGITGSSIEKAEGEGGAVWVESRSSGGLHDGGFRMKLAGGVQGPGRTDFDPDGWGGHAGVRHMSYQVRCAEG